MHHRTHSHQQFEKYRSLPPIDFSFSKLIFLTSEQSEFPIVMLQECKGHRGVHIGGEYQRH